MNSSVTVAAHTKCQLGEGLIWDKVSQLMRLVDIHGKQTHAFRPDSDAHQTWQLDERMGWLIPSQGNWVGGFQSGIAKFRFEESGRIKVEEWLARPFENRPFMRFNDAKCDPAGNIWTGSLNNEDESQPDGVFYKLTPRDGLVAVDNGYCVPNGPAISSDGKTMLHTDSVKRTVYAFDLEAETGMISNKRIWKVIQDADGYPDGMSFDSEGCLWMAHWGAGFVGRYSPSGELLRRIAVPAPNVTNVAFGGARLDRLFVTTARVGLTDQALNANPQSGCVFEIHEHGVQGYETPQYRG